MKKRKTALNNKKLKSLCSLAIFTTFSIFAVSASYTMYQKKFLDPRSKAAGGKDGGFGMALGNWNQSEVQCYKPNGSTVNCNQEGRKLDNPNFSEMAVTSYRNSNYTLAPAAFNISAPYALDPNANTIFVLYHFTNSHPGIPLQSDAPGQIKVSVSDNNGKPLLTPNNTNGTYIYRKKIFKQHLVDNWDYDDGNGNWYAFYFLSEVEGSTNWCSITYQQYFDVLKEYVNFLKSVQTEIYNKKGVTVKPRIILASPIIGDHMYIRTNPTTPGGTITGQMPTSMYQTYYNNLWNLIQSDPISNTFNNFFAYNSIDVFYGPPPGPDYDLSRNGVTYKAVTEDELVQIANKTYESIKNAGQFFYNLNGKPTLITQFGSRLHNPVQTPVGWGSIDCAWCTSDSQVFNTTEWGHARLTQLILKRLVDGRNKSHVLAWAYWGGAKQDDWTDPYTQKQWGNLKHGVMWLAWNIILNQANYNNYGGSTAFGEPFFVTNQIWPTRVGTVYLHAANRDPCYKDPKAPSWWSSGCL